MVTAGPSDIQHEVIFTPHQVFEPTPARPKYLTKSHL
jgi:hypothetical protein